MELGFNNRLSDKEAVCKIIEHTRNLDEVINDVYIIHGDKVSKDVLTKNYFR